MNELREALAEALQAAGIEVDTNVCTCGHGGWDHDLDNRCLVCGDRFGSMDKADLWRWWMDRVAFPPGSWLAGPEERAVIEAAKAWRAAWTTGGRRSMTTEGALDAAGAVDALAVAVDALMEADRGDL